MSYIGGGMYYAELAEKHSGMAGARTLTATTTGTRRRMMKTRRTIAMENKPKMPFSMKMTLAILSGDRQAVDRIAAECIGEMVTKFLDVAHGYDYTDLPFVVAAMRTAANSIYMVLDDHGKSLADTIHNRTHCIGINMDELRKQMKSANKKSIGK